MTFICDKCGRRLPTYIDGRLNIAYSGNIDGLHFEVCHDCDNPTVEEAIESMELWFNPIKELV